MICSWHTCVFSLFLSCASLAFTHPTDLFQTHPIVGSYFLQLSPALSQIATHSLPLSQIPTHSLPNSHTLSPTVTLSNCHTLQHSHTPTLTHCNSHTLSPCLALFPALCPLHDPLQLLSFSLSPFPFHSHIHILPCQLSLHNILSYTRKVASREIS